MNSILWAATKVLLLYTVVHVEFVLISLKCVSFIEIMIKETHCFTTC